MIRFFYKANPNSDHKIIFSDSLHYVKQQMQHMSSIFLQNILIE